MQNAPSDGALNFGDLDWSRLKRQALFHCQCDNHENCGRGRAGRRCRASLRATAARDPARDKLPFSAGSMLLDGPFFDTQRRRDTGSQRRIRPRSLAPLWRWLPERSSSPSALPRLSVFQSARPPGTGVPVQCLCAPLASAQQEPLEEQQSFFGAVEQAESPKARAERNTASRHFIGRNDCGAAGCWQGGKCSVGGAVSPKLPWWCSEPPCTFGESAPPMLEAFRRSRQPRHPTLPFVPRAALLGREVFAASHELVPTRRLHDRLPRACRGR